MTTNTEVTWDELHAEYLKEIAAKVAAEKAQEELESQVAEAEDRWRQVNAENERLTRCHGMTFDGMCEELGRLDVEVDRLTKQLVLSHEVIEAARKYRAAKIETSKHGWSAVIRESEPLEQLFKALIRLDDPDA